MAISQVRPTVYRRRRFAERYTRADIELLASADEARETLSGPATRRILERGRQLYGKQEYTRLTAISVAHLYNLRRSRRYRERRLNYVKTRPTTVSVGERRKPNPQGRPGYLRLDTVHRGDQPEAKSVFHIDAVDQVPQWQLSPHGRRPVRGEPRVVGLNTAYLGGVSEACSGGHAAPVPVSHPGLSYRQRQPVHQPHRRRTAQQAVDRTDQKPAPAERRSAAAEAGGNQERRGDSGIPGHRSSSLGWMIRKHIGYGYIDAKHADAINDFYRDYFNPYLNYHRPYAQPDVKIDEKGRKRVRYRRYQTLLETLSLLDKPAQCPRDGLSINALKTVAAAIGDTDAARRLQPAKNKLFEMLRIAA